MWIEGRTDTACLNPVLRDLPVRFERANGKKECEKLVNALRAHDYPFVVVRDGDYNVLQYRRSVHRRALMLQRYSAENYLFEFEGVLAFCIDYAEMIAERSQDVDSVGRLANDLYADVITKMDTALRSTILLDIANHLQDGDHAALPHRIEAVLEGSDIEFSRARLDSFCDDCRRHLESASIERASRLLAEFLSRHRLVDVLRGHLAFGLLRMLVFSVVKRALGRKPHIDDRALALILAEKVWRTIGSSSADHRNLKRRLRAAVREALALRAA